MKILHLPLNTASQASIAVRALRDLGVEARGLTVNASPIQGDEAIKVLPVVSLRQHPVAGAVAMLSKSINLGTAIAWADVVHWHSGGRALPGAVDIAYTAMLRKPRLVEFWGSEIRNPDIATADNPYLRDLLARPDNTYDISAGKSAACQSLFGRHGFAALIPGAELLNYIQPELFPAVFTTEAGLILADFEPTYVDPDRRRPVIVHSPSKPTLKGTDAVLDAVEQLRAHYDFDFQLIHQVPHDHALAMVRDCDIFLDQFVIGSFGTAALEAMAFGKPAVCYLRPTVVSQLPADLPIVNATQDNLASVLAGLLNDGHYRAKLGRAGRVYVEAHHNAHRLAHEWLDVYAKLLERRR
jgi:hypothetical protein